MNIEDIKPTIIQQHLKELKPNCHEQGQIIQLTQQNQKKQQGKRLNQNLEQNIQHKSCCDCLKNIVQLLTSRFYKRHQTLVQFTTTQAQISKTLNLIKNLKLQPILPAQKQPTRKTLVLDLDETLIHTTFEKNEHYDYQIQMESENNKSSAFIIKRFGLSQFLLQMSKYYELIIYTAARKQYADKIINKIDPKRKISHRLYRNHTICLNQRYHLKTLQILGRDLKNVIIVDDNSLAGLLQPSNFYHIQPFTGNIKDRKLIQLASFLKYLNQRNQLRSIPSLRKKYQAELFQENQVNKQNVNITNFASKQPHKTQLSSKMKQGYANAQQADKTQQIKKQKTRKYTHNRINSQVEQLINRNDNEDIPLDLFKSEDIPKVINKMC